MSVVCCKNGGMDLAAWAERNGVARVAACRWFRVGRLPVSALVFDSCGVDDGLVRDMTEVLTSMCARWYGERAAATRARRVITAGDDGEAA